MLEDGGRGEGGLEEFKHTLAFAIPVPWSVLPDEPVRVFCDARVVVNELVVEIGKTQEGLYFLDIIRRGQLRIASTLVGSMKMPSKETMTLRYLTSVM